MPARPTPRQAQIIEFLAQGLSNKEIGERLDLTEGTVKTYNYHLFRRLPELGGRYGAARYVARRQERQLAIRWNEWLQRHGQELNPDGLAGIKGIIAEQAGQIGGCGAGV